ncbi:helix-turn-helix domain-containing protein [Streptomyces sp. NPDC090994]|uniref:helix-turn-helix domain-containing protein n=1 Tax=Streptomyces sp. NPDC090994 TaxID=3365969 RepID=UPI0038167BBD
MTESPAIPLPPPKARRRLREAASLTPAQLAARVGVTRETVRAWETGRMTPRGRKRETYAKLLARLAQEAQRTGEAVVWSPPERPTPTAPAKPEREQAREQAREQQEPKAETKTEAEAEVETEAEAEAETGMASEPEPGPEPGPAPQSEPPHEPVPSPPALTPAQAFDALYAFCAPALVRQAYLLTGRRELARDAVERAFQLAWERWPEVARDRDPAGWVRAAAYEAALSPWHRFRLRPRRPEPPAADADGRVLLDALLKLPPSRRRTLVLYDGVGLGLPETAAETEATTPAAANRLLSAREAVAARLPELADPAVLHRRLAELASTARLRASEAPTVRTGGERRARFWTRAAIAFTAALIGTTALTLRTAPTQYEPPVPVGEAVRGVPARVAPGPLSDEELSLRDKLRQELQDGPERLVPQAR